MGKEDRLSGKEAKFCNEYSIDYNATQAAIRAGYSAKTAYSMGSALLKKDKIGKEIEKIRENLAEAAGISALRILREHECIAFSRIGILQNRWLEKEYFEKLTDPEKASIQEMSFRTVKVKQDNGEICDVEYIRFKLYDKQRSLETISTILGFNSPIKAEFSSSNEINLLTGLDLEKLTVEDREMLLKIAEKLSK